MKKYLLFALVTMMSLVANAQLKQTKAFSLGPRSAATQSTPAMAPAIAGTSIWGYYTGNDISDLGGLGTGSTGVTFRVGIKVPGTGILRGKKIRGVNVPALGAMSNASVWIAKGLEASNITMSKSFTASAKGFVAVEFDEPVEVPTEGFILGYTFKSNDTYPIATAEGSMAGSLYLATSATDALIDMSGDGYGMSALQLFVEDMVIPEYGVGVADILCETSMPGAKNTAIVKVVSDGNKGAQTVGYTFNLNGVETTGTATVNLAGGLNHYGQFSIDFTAPAGIDAYPASVAITTVNGQPNELSTEPAPFKVTTVSRLVPRLTVIEEFTGTGCPWCTRGWVGMEAVKNEKSDKAVVIAWHRYNSTDAMYQANYGPLAFKGAPSCMVDRKSGELDPYYGDNDGDDGILETVDNYSNVVPTVDIKVKANFVDDTNKEVKVTSNTEFLTNTKGYTIAYVLTADELSGTTSAWKQANNYASYTAAQAGILPSIPELAKFCKGGEYGKSYVALTFNDAMIGSTYGTNGKTTVPAFTTGQAGDKEKSEATIAMPTKTALLNALKYDKIYVTAIVVDEKGQIANAARVRVLGAGEGGDDPVVPEPIEIDGLKVSVASDQVQVMGEAMSPNAKYVVGTNYATYAPVVWNVETGAVTDFADYEEGAFHAANSNGVFVGDDGNGEGFAIKVDSEGNVTPLYREVGEEVYNEEFDFYYSTGDAGSSAYAVSEDGKTIAGFYFDSAYKTTPCIWNENNQRIDLPVPSSDEAGFEVSGAQVRYMTPDGKVLVGFLIDNMSTWPACIWRQNTTGGYDVDIICKNYWEEGYQMGKPYMVFNPSGISANGEWVALQIQKEFDDWDFSVPQPALQLARLNLKNNNLEILPVEDDSYSPTAIANDGTMLAYTGGNAMMERVGYVWKAGSNELVNLNDILATVPELEELGSNTPCSITPDGAYLQGFGINGEDIFSYVFDFAKYETSGIKDVKVENKVSADRIYNINGQQVKNMNGRGLYIINGKKMTVK